MEIDLEEFEKTAQPHDYGEISEENQWDNLKYFLEHTVPVAEEGV